MGKSEAVFFKPDYNLGSIHFSTFNHVQFLFAAVGAPGFIHRSDIESVEKDLAARILVIPAVATVAKGKDCGFAVL